LLAAFFTAGAVCEAWECRDAQLVKEWQEMLGYKAPDMVGKVAPEIKKGMVIDSSNYKDYPGLQDLMLPSVYARLDPGSYAPLAPIKIVETDQHVLSRGFMEKSKENLKTCHFAEDNLTLIGYQGGFPFIPPKNGNELAMWCDNSYLGDTFAMRPMRLRLVGRDNRPEREMRQNLNFFRYFGCTDWKEDEKENPEMIHYFNAGVFTFPRDVSGSAYVRRRFLDASRPDEFLLYVPSMRRIRRMGGRDTQDPLFGSDLVWDDFNIWWQKLSPTDFPNDYIMKQTVEMLSPTFVSYDYPDDRETAGYTDYNVNDSGDQVFVNFGSWQRRPFYPLEVISKDPNYMYSKRIILVDPETGLLLQTEMFDQSGRLWRSWLRDYNLSETGTGVMEDIIDIVDHVNQHRTILDFKGHMNPHWMGPEYGDVRYLSRMAK
jgi:hypothetical protein